MAFVRCILIKFTRLDCCSSGPRPPLRCS